MFLILCYILCGSFGFFFAEELSFQKKARQREEAAGENDECSANVDVGSTPVTTGKALLMADKNKHIHAFLNDIGTLNVANLSGYLNTEIVEHSFEHQRTRGINVEKLFL